MSKDRVVETFCLRRVPVLLSLWFDTEWFFYVTFIDVSADDALLGGVGGVGRFRYPLSLKVSTVLSLKVSLLEFFPQTKVKN